MCRPSRNPRRERGTSAPERHRHVTGRDRRSNRDPLGELLLFESTRTDAGKFTTLSDYVSRMPEAQHEILYSGESRELLLQAPVLEGYMSSGQEVLLLTEPIDEWVVQSLPEFKGKKLKAVDKRLPCNRPHLLT